MKVSTWKKILEKVFYICIGALLVVNIYLVLIVILVILLVMIGSKIRRQQGHVRRE